MADDLDDEWWTEENDKYIKGQSENEDCEGDSFVSDSPSAAKRRSYAVLSTEERPPKKKSKRKKISEVLAKKEQVPIKYTDLITAIDKHFESKLSSVEKDDILLSESHFAQCGSLSDTVSSYLHTVMTVSKWKKKVKAMQQTPGQPLLLIICSAASRAVDLIRDLRSFSQDNCKVAKLFAKHMKLEEQVKFLKKNVIQAGVGTPNRISTLLDTDSLSLNQTYLVMIDWTWRDAKLRRLVDIPEVRDEFYKLLQKYLVPKVKASTAKFALF